jgi:hypothetical protein
MAELQDCLQNYRTKFSARPPDLRNQRFDDELKQFDDSDGMQDLPSAPAVDYEPGAPPKEYGDGLKKYLWVILVYRHF